MVLGGRRLWPGVQLLLVVVVTAAIDVFIYRAKGDEPSAALVGQLVGVPAGAAPLIVWLWKRIKPTEAKPLSLSYVADELAKELNAQWRNAANARGLIRASLIPVRWEWCEEVPGRKSAAIGGSFSSLPDLPRVTEEDLQSGELKDLLRVYGGLGSGRLVILGEPGSGKTAAGIRLLRDALDHRLRVTPTNQTLMPVPVLITPQGWNPTEQPFLEWLAARLVQDYELLRVSADTAKDLIEGDYLIVILDGLEVISEERRPEALRKLSKTDLRLVLLAGKDELIKAGYHAHLEDAAALELQPISAEQAGVYLTNYYQIRSAHASWQTLLGHLGDPDSVLARALNNPLTLALIRSTYDPRDDVDELIRFTSVEEIEKHLLDQVLNAAYTRKDHQSALAYSPYSIDQARPWLSRLARRMNDEKAFDLTWWKIPRWAPAWPRAVTTIVLISLFSALLLAFVYLSGLAADMSLLSKFQVGPSAALVAVFGKTLGFAFIFGYGLLLVSSVNSSGFSQQGQDPPERSTADIRTVLLIALGIGAGFGLEPGLLLGASYGLVHGFVASFVVGLGLILGAGPPQRLGPLRWHETDTRTIAFTGLVIGLLTWLACGLAYGSLYGFNNGFRQGITVGIIYTFLIVSGGRRPEQKSPLQWGKINAARRTLLIGLAIALVSTAGYGFIYILIVTLSGGPPLHGRLRWHRTDTPVSLLTGLFTGLMYGLAYGFTGSLTGGISLSGLLYGLLSGLVFGATGGLLLGLRPSTVDTTPLDPPSSWRRERKSGIVVGLTFGFAVGLVYLLVNWLEFGPAVGIVYGLANGLVAGLGSRLVFSANWAVALTSLQLWLRKEAPPRLLPFLDDACKRAKILQTVGVSYQFVYVRLQHHLAERPDKITKTLI